MKGKTPRSVLTSKIETEIELLQRHVAMLKAIMDNEPIGIIRLSEMLEHPQHKVRYSLRILEQEGLPRPPEGHPRDHEQYGQ
jgi:predicted transcriptional regulator